jgi:type VI protein secretion system component VasK
MALTPEEDRALARQSRTVSFVIAGAMLVWLAAPWLGPQLGLRGEYAILVDLFALAALGWALIVTYRIWRKRRSN